MNKVNVTRPDRDFLLAIKAGKFGYEELLKMADQKQAETETAFEQSDLPEHPDLVMINELTFRIRDEYYKEKENNNEW